MKSKVLLLAVSLTLGASLPLFAQFHPVECYITSPDGTMLLSRDRGPLEFTPGLGDGKNLPIVVDPRQKFQEMIGFGYALTGGSAELMMKMSPSARKGLIHELFSSDEGCLGISHIRLTVGASDMNSFVFSYDDMPEGEEDWDLGHFSLSQDLVDVVPVMKEILKVNPGLQIIASPWSAPAWMKTTGDVRGGQLRAQCYDVYARYFVRYIEEMAKEGIHISAITIQNEPLNSRNTPSMFWFPEQQGEFVGKHLGPRLRERGLDTKIVIFDHNCDRPDYPLSVLSDNGAAQYVDGIAFHHYMGSPSAMTWVHQARPEVDILFTEQMIVERGEGAQTRQIASTVKRMLVDIPRNWSRNVILWNLAADPSAGPHTGNGGCPFCFGAVTIDGDNYTRNIAYYTLAHASAFIPSGSERIYSTDEGDPGIVLFEDEQRPEVDRAIRYDRAGVLPNVAFLTPGGKVVLIVSNTTSSSVPVKAQYKGMTFGRSLESGAVATFIWDK